MPTFLVLATIENKSGISDPEGDTILNDLVLKGDYSSVSKIRTGKILKFQIKGKTKEKAKKTVHSLCDDLRIYNPMVSKLSLEVQEI